MVPGDLVAFNNRRVLHARSSYDASKMDRSAQTLFWTLLIPNGIATEAEDAFLAEAGAEVCVYIIINYGLRVSSDVNHLPAEIMQMVIVSREA